MPTVKLRVIERTLKRKFGFIIDETHHHMYHFIYNGRRVVSTRLSHKTGNADITKGIVGTIARDIQLKGPQFQRAIQCSFSREDYLEQLALKGLLHRRPR